MLWVYTHNIYKGRNHIIKKGKNMPKLNQTGPAGLGPKTGRGLGSCGGGRGFGMRRGGLMRCLRPWTKKESLEVLQEEKEILQEELKEVQDGIKELENEK